MKAEIPSGLSLENIERYLDNRTKDFSGLLAAVEAHDKGGIRGLAHRIKGNAALYGMPELGLAAGRVVEAVDSEDWADVSLQVDAMLARLEVERRRFSDGAPSEGTPS